MIQIGGRNSPAASALAALIALAALLAAGACSFDGDGFFEPAPCALPAVASSTLRENPGNVLSVFVTTTTRGADSAFVRFGENASLDSSTPPMAAAPDSLVAPVLGLRAQTTYRAQVVAFNRCGMSAGDIATFTTGVLPTDLSVYSASGSDPSPGYVVFAAGKYGLAIDNKGRVVWYHRFANGPGLNFQPQPNGRYAARPTPVFGEVAAWTETNADGTAARTLGCARGLQTRPHDLIAQADGSYWLLCDETRVVDLSARGLPYQASVLGTGVQHRSASGEVLFEWSPFDHLPIDVHALEPSDLVGPVINWTHGNALDLDPDGNLLVSFRNLSEVIKIDTRTGSVLWRMGGARNQFSFDQAGTRPFARQHGVRSVGRGRILLLDNLGEQLGSRAELYEINEGVRSARLAGAYTSTALVTAELGGNTQVLAGGRTLVSFGSGGAVEEFDAAGNVVWRLDGNPGYVFRAQRIRSLYSPGIGESR